MSFYVKWYKLSFCVTWYKLSFYVKPFPYNKKLLSFNRYKAEPQFSALPNASATENDPEAGFPETGKDVPELEEKVRGPATVLTTGFRQGKEMFLVLYTTKLVIFKDEGHFNVRVLHKITSHN